MIKSQNVGENKFETPKKGKKICFKEKSWLHKLGW